MSTPHARFRSRSLGLLFVAFACIIHAPPSSAQYMYLDTNGDGIHTAADQVHPAGVTVADIWIDTDSNRDGSAAVCSTDPSRPMTINSYVFALRASNGTIDWLGYINQLAGATIVFGQGSSATEYWIGFGGPVINPPGTYRLGTLNFTVASGTPSIQFIPQATGSVDYTSFGSNCWGVDFDNTLKLGTDWNDADGLPFGSGGGQGPLLAPVQDMTVPAGESASQTLSASDADGQPLSFSKASGPDYANVITVAPGSGTASGGVHLAPFASDAGSQEVVISVSDGAASDEGSFTSTVVSSANHAPHATVPAFVRVGVESRRRVSLSGGDSDGQLLHWRLVSGPAYARVLDLATRPGGGAGVLELTPGLGDVGSASAVVGVTDGASEAQFVVAVEVVPEVALPPDPVHTAPSPHGGVAIATGDFNQDGLPDMATATGAGNSVTIYQTLPTGAIQGIGEIPTGIFTSAILAGDVDEDGVLDLVTSNRGDNSILVLIGSGQGTFTPRPAQTVGNSPSAMRSGDWNRDGHLDLAIANLGSDDLSLLLGRGDGTFDLAPRVAVGGTPSDLAAADFNLDGRLDIAVVVRSAGEIRIFRGFGNGTFAPSGSASLGGMPVKCVTADWNGDGVLDFAVQNIGTNSVQIVLGQADGTYQVAGTLPVSPDAMETGDVNSDGFADIVVTAIGLNLLTEIRIYRGAGDGTFPVVDTFPSLADLALALDDANLDGFPDVFAISNGYAQVSLRLVPYGAGLAEARAFTKNTRPIGKGGGNASVCVLLEPVNESYANTDLVLSSLRLRSPETGSVDEIVPIPGKGLVQSDVDGNGVMEVSICFAKSDITRLFDELGRQTVTAYLEGALADGRVFSAGVSFEVNGGGGGGALTATVSPNPLNPRATLRFRTSRDGAVKIRMYDLHGRVVRTFLDKPMLPAGSHEVEVDGRTENGQTLASGVYFYEVKAAEGTVRGRLTILK
jgi:hypothetical protein